MIVSTEKDVDVLIDAGTIYARSYFASKRSETCPVIAGIRSFCGIINHTGATRAIFCWDGKSKTTKPREEKPADYEDLKAPFKEAIQKLWGVPQIVSVNHEADDLVASLVYSDLVSKEVCVISGDKDLQQLIGCRSDVNVRYYCLNTKTFITDNDVFEKWFVQKPSHIAIALAILGDSGDGIPGIKGWGPAKVKKLFQDITKHMTFEEAVLAVDEQIPDPLKDTFYTCLEAAILHQDADIECGPKTLEWSHPSLLEDLGFEAVKDQYSTGYYNAIPVSDDEV